MCKYKFIESCSSSYIHQSSSSMKLVRHSQARVQGGPRGLGPPLEIEKQKKKKDHQSKY